MEDMSLGSSRVILKLRFFYSFIILAQAVLFKATQIIFNKPTLLLWRKINKHPPLQISFNTVKAVRPHLEFTGRTFSVESDHHDFEVENARQRLIFFKHLLVAKSLISQKNILLGLGKTEFYFGQNRGVLSSYNYSEAVSNIAHLFLQISAGNKEVSLSHHITSVLKKLLDHISAYPEYYYLLTNNHLLNNARALLLGGLILKDSAYLTRGITFLRCGLFMFQKMGIFRERSSHYHLIIFLWLYDMTQIINQLTFDGRDFIYNKIETLLRSNLEVTLAILEHSNALIPLIGDISPDESPCYTSLFARHVSSSLGNSDQIKMGWNTKGEWYFFKNSVWSVVCCPQENLSSEYPTHGHDDWGAFSLSKLRQNILVDIGRYSYSKNQLSLHQTSREGHTSLSIQLDGNNIMLPRRFACSKYIISREVILNENTLSFIEKYHKMSFKGQWTRCLSGNREKFNVIDTVLVSRPCDAVFTFFFSKEWYNLNGESIQFDFGRDTYTEKRLVKKVKEVCCSQEYLSIENAVEVTFSIKIIKSFTLKTSFV